jgi:TonB family protein
MRSRPTLGPALRRVPLPFGPLALSAVAHVAVMVGLWAGATAWRASQPKTYVVNLVPTVAAVGSPRGRETPSLPSRVTEPAPPSPRTAPTELPRREPTRELPRPEMPARLPERVMPPRPPAIPRAGAKELPRPPARELPPAVTAAAKPAPAPPPPPPPLGRPGGSPQGAGRVSLTVGDFPFAWYLRVIERKIQDSWRRPAGSREGQEAVAIFEISPDGQVRQVSIEKTSGDAVYDQAAVRAIMEANPFPPLPPEFKEPPLRVHLGFAVRDRG